MYVRRRYEFWMTFNWSKWSFIYGTLYGGAVAALSYFLGEAIAIPWAPLSLIGIAVSFYLGFKNNSSYDRSWEARKIWGSIVNNSRTFGAAVMSFVQGPEQDKIRKELIYRHLAWLTALRHQLRLSKPWEHVDERVKGVYSPTICEDYNNKLYTELEAFIPQDEIDVLAHKDNDATHILKVQAQRLQQLRDMEMFEDFRHMEFHQLIAKFYADQGKSERIKNFPFPRQYASATIWITVVFCAVVPFGLMDILQTGPDWMLWLCPPLSGTIIWIFMLMEKIGDYSENPFEGTYNDIPITSIARTIEIDLRAMLDEEEIPAAFEPENGFLM